MPNDDRQTPRTPGAPGTGLRRLHTVEEVAETLQLSGSTVRRAIRSGLLATVRVGRSVRLAQADVDAWLDTSRRPARR